jgi:hypothetical protein
MKQKPTNQSRSSSPCNDDELTETKLPTPRRLQTRQRESSLEVRKSKAFTISIDEQGTVRLLRLGQEITTLQPEEAYDLLDFLFEQRNLLAARSAEAAEQ